jgi:hypothetical protein
MFLPPSATTWLHDAAAKHYTSLRFALASRKVGMVVTANPSSLVELARRANKQCEPLLRDIHDGTLSWDIPAPVREALRSRIAKRNPRRARELERLINQHGALLPKHAWPGLSVIAVWTGGSIGIFLPRLAELYGDAAIRDHGLSASEGRMTIPLADHTSAGLLDFHHHYFEFIPVEEYGKPHAITLEGHEREEGRDYYVLLTTSGGLYRYDIHDVVRCVGFQGQAPLLEFLNKGKNFSNITGEKLSEYQVIRAFEKTFADMALPIDFFLVAPVVDGEPGYVLLLEKKTHQNRQAEIAARFQTMLSQLNEEYAEKCASGRLLPALVREVPPGTWNRMRADKTSARGNFEEYKHVCLSQDLSLVEHLTSEHSDSTQPVVAVSLGGACS